MDKELEKRFEIKNRNCEALVLAYQPNQTIAHDRGRGFYIPSRSDVEGAFGYALRNIFGEMRAGSHWADSVRWNTIKDLDKLEKRILEGSQSVICGQYDIQTFFDSYLSSMSGRLEHTWIYMAGDFYRYLPGEREKAKKNFENYWTEEEKKRWKQIHKLMRKCRRN